MRLKAKAILKAIKDIEKEDVLTDKNASFAMLYERYRKELGELITELIEGSSDSIAEKTGNIVKTLIYCMRFNNFTQDYIVTTLNNRFFVDVSSSLGDRILILFVQNLYSIPSITEAVIILESIAKELIDQNLTICLERSMRNDK